MKILLIMLLLLGPFKILAEEDIVPEPKKDELIFNNELDNIIAPFTYHSSAVMFLGGLGTYLVFEDNYREKKKRRIDDGDKPWRDIGDALGWGPLPLFYAGIMGTSYLFSDDRANGQYGKKTEYVLKSVIYTALATFTLKTLIDQRRPKDKLKEDSFPSGHASSSFAFSTAIWMVHGPYWGSLATALAAWVSYSRIDDGSHYWHDSVFGMTLGISYALGIYNNHFKRELPFQFAVVPVHKGLGASLSYEF
jgi:membrane-associated phospholipid phosphatase